MKEWSPLAGVYDEQLEVLEAARSAYRRRSQELLGTARKAALGVAASSTWRLDVDDLEEDWDEALLDGARYLQCWAPTDLGTVISVAVWMASAWGGPSGTVRIGMGVDAVPDDRVLPGDEFEWAHRVAQALPSGLVGEPYEPGRFPDADRDGGAWSRIVSIKITSREQTPAEVSSAMKSLLVDGVPHAQQFVDARASPCVQAETVLEAYRPVLEGLGQVNRMALTPGKGLGSWSGCSYLQIGEFWLFIDSRKLELSAGAQKGHLGSVVGLATGPEERRDGYLTVPVLDLKEASEGEIHAVIDKVFRTWLDERSSAG